MIECFEGQKRPAALVIPLVLFDNKEFVKWHGTAEAKVWYKMNRHIVRGKMVTKFNKKIYKNYYKNGILAMYKEQEDIAEFLGLKSKARVSEQITNMIEKGIIIPHKDVKNNRSVTIYELGTHDMGPNKHENLHLHIYFTKLNADQVLKDEFDI